MSEIAARTPRPFATRLSTIQPSATLAIGARANAMRAQGIDVISLSVGEPDFDTPMHIQDAIVSAVREGYSRYTPTPGLPAVRACVARHSERRRKIAHEPAEVIVTSGSKAALFNLALALYEPGEEVLIPTPCWVSYPEQVRFAGATPVFVPTTEETSFRVDPALVAERITERSKAIILCAPSNPTGAGISDEDLRGIADLALRHGLWVISDEIYTSLVYGGYVQRSILEVAPELRDRTVVVDGLSKTYAMTGYRLGWILAPRNLATACDTLQSQSTSHATAAVQMAALAALEGDATPVEVMRRVFEERRDRLLAGLARIPGITCAKPVGAFYAFPSVRGLLGKQTPDGKRLTSGTDVANDWLDRARVAVVPGAPFEAPDHVRLSYAAATERIDEALRRIADAVSGLRSP
ncbi:MAG: pyridoxal phosphate-dependent aminotransferase [Deltaproteobacteria bacterium]|nr:pyridoxal phosphate-dependent aminotransferase [Deltaproteobacteria bacterium]